MTLGRRKWMVYASEASGSSLCATRTGVLWNPDAPNSRGRCWGERSNGCRGSFISEVRASHRASDAEQRLEARMMLWSCLSQAASAEGRKGRQRQRRWRQRGKRQRGWRSGTAEYFISPKERAEGCACVRVPSLSVEGDRCTEASERHLTEKERERGRASERSTRRPSPSSFLC
jgi:hypothetical protein